MLRRLEKPVHLGDLDLQVIGGCKLLPVQPHQVLAVTVEAPKLTLDVRDLRQGLVVALLLLLRAYSGRLPQQFRVGQDALDLSSDGR